jgi:TRAP-type C4-dicarboxylate transport system substrate-binding protein
VPYSELVTALQTGLLDCGQGGVGLYATAGIAGEAPHLTLTYHIFDTGLVVANSAWLESLSAPVRQTLVGSLESADEGRRQLRAALARIQAEDLPRLGVSVYEPSPAERDSWQAAAAGSAEEVLEITGGRAREIFSLIQQGQRAFRTAGQATAGNASAR